MNRGPENRGYAHFTEQLAQQFVDGENVDTHSLDYLERFSDESRRHYDLLMDRVASMYDVEPVDVRQETRVRSLGNSAIG
jgi:hypothetical protein